MKQWQKYEMLDSLIGKIGHQFTYQDGDEKNEIRFTDARAGIAWATDQSPFCIVIAGQQFFDETFYADKEPSFSVIFEGIDHGLDLEKRFNNLADIAALYKCDFYADLDPKFEAESDAWYEHHSHRKMQYGDLEEAPWAQNFRLGIELCKTAVRTHRLTLTKDCEVFSQLARITEKDLADKDVKSRFYCVEALRHVVASFKRDPADNPQINSGRDDGRKQEQGWMS